MSTQPPQHALEPDHDLKDVAKALRMSEKWVRERVREGAEHQRYGQKIRFTTAQVEKLRAQFTQEPPVQSLTTGRRRRAS